MNTQGDKTDQNFRQNSKVIGKYIGKKGAKKLLAILAKFFTTTSPFWIILLVVVIAIGAIYSIFPGGNASSSENKQVFFSLDDVSQNEKAKAYYEEIADKNNFRDMWLNTIYEQTNTDILIKKLGRQQAVYSKNDIINILNNSTYIGTHGKDTERNLKDYYGRDTKFKIDYGTIHAANLINVLTFGKSETTDEFKEQVGEAFRPYLYYKDSEIKSCSYSKTDGWTCTTRSIYLLTEANTIRGHYKYTYEQKTIWSDDGTHYTTYEAPVSETLVNKEWERLDQWIYAMMGNTKEDVVTTREMLIEAGVGFKQDKQNLEWLFKGYHSSFNISSAILNPALLEYLKKAGDAFRIPSWFLMAIAWKESSFDANAYNEQTKAYGLMQLIPSNQKIVVDTLVSQYPDLLSKDFLELYNSTENKDEEFYQQIVADPYINILGGCIVLTNCGLDASEVDWKGDWHSETLPVLASYGGYSYVPKNLWSTYGIKSAAEAKSQEKVLAWTLNEYAQDIFDYAANFSITAAAPFVGTYPITTEFGQKGDWLLGWHTGIDYAAPAGTPLYSVFNGEVKLAQVYGDYGNCVVITNYNYEVLYGHLSQIDVAAGQFVSVGQQIGLSGNTGNSTGPHLHLEVRTYNGEQSEAIDPTIFFSKLNQ